MELNILESLLRAKRQGQAFTHIQTEQIMKEIGKTINRKEMVLTHMQTKKFLKANGKTINQSYPYTVKLKYNSV